MTKKTVRAGALAVLGALAAVTTSPHALAAEASHKSHNLLGESVGLVGYDPVSYFPEGGGEPAKSLISISAEYEGVT